jgi:predicted nucleic acid-binding Zn ribbon protein
VTEWDPPDPPQPHRLGESLARVAGSLGLGPPAALGAVFGRWEEVVGPAVAAHSRPLSLRRGTLVVGVEHAGWATELRYLEKTLLGRLSEACGEGAVGRIEVRVRPR